MKHDNVCAADAVAARSDAVIRPVPLDDGSASSPKPDTDI